MNINSPFPLDVDQLLAAVDNIYPDKCPSLTDADREVWFKAGQRSVVAFLKAWRKASLEKHPAYVPGQNPKNDRAQHSNGEAAADVREPVLHRRGRRRPPRSARSKRP